MATDATRFSIEVQTADFDLPHEMAWLRGDSVATGAIATFTGLVRDFSERPDVQAMILEHYPGMTERSLQRIAEEAAQRWRLLAVRILHRVGELRPGDQIVFVGVSSAHRADAFAACEFVMDYLKVQAPFWKKEVTREGAHWVSERESDLERARNWREDAGPEL